MRAGHSCCLVLLMSSCLTLPAGRAHGEDRVKAARLARSEDIKALFKVADVTYPPAEIFLRAFKSEGVVELWAASSSGAPLKRVKRYGVCMSSGSLGPKRERGDLQVPEGFYEIDRFNPWSNFHLSLGVSYPNPSDRIRGAKNPGGDIFIHGSCVTIGCLPLRDGPIEELYVIALDARTNGQKRIPVHLFPARMDEDGMRYLAREAEDVPELYAFWQELLPGYLAFEKTRRPPKISITSKGAYVVKEIPPQRRSVQAEPLERLGMDGGEAAGREHGSARGALK